MATFDTYDTRADLREQIEDANIALLLRGASPRRLSRFAGALAAECTAQGIWGAIVHFCQGQGVLDGAEPRVLPPPIGSADCRPIAAGDADLQLGASSLGAAIASAAVMLFAIAAYWALADLLAAMVGG